MLKNHKNKIAALFLLSLIFSLAFAFSSFARSLSYSQHYYDAFINSDGSMDMEEWITYDFSGKYNGVYQNISYDKADSLTDLRVYKADSLDSAPSGNLTLLSSSYSQSSDTYELSEDYKMVKIKLYTPSENTKKTYVYKYKINGVISKYTDIAELYWQFVSSSNETPAENVSVYIHLPQASKKEDLRIWAHGPLTGLSQILDNQTVKLSIDYLPSYNFVEARLLFSPDIISSNYPLKNYPALSSILDEEGRWADEANATRDKAREDISQRNIFPYSKRGYISSGNKTLDFLFTVAAVFGVLSSVIIVLLIIIRLIKNILPPRKPQDLNYEYYRELPSDLLPAEVGVLMHKKASQNDISATLLDLVRRKHLVISQQKEHIDGIFFDKDEIDYRLSVNETDQPTDELKEHEKFLIDWFINDLGNSSSVSFSDIKHKLKHSESAARKYLSKFSKWQDKVKAETISLGLVKVEAFKFKNTSMNILGILFAVFSVLLNPIFNIFGLAILYALLSGYKLTDKGIEEYYKWKAFEKFLNDFSNMDFAEVPSLIIWEHYLVYAVTLGVADKVIEKLKILVPVEDFDNTNLTILHSGTRLVYSDGFKSFNTAFKGISTAAIANSTSSSSHGGGGGFSGGGGGGGGGSSGGGF